jgi:predicted amidohydrolase YtcJ
MRSLSLLFLAALFACAPAPAPVSTAVPVAENGTLFIGSTVAAGADQEPGHDLAIHVVGGVIREVGPAASLRASHPGAKIVEAAGATILPGLVDAHGHLLGLGLSLQQVDLVGSTSYAEVIERVRTRAATAGAGEWILGRGWDQNDWPVKEFPTAAELDAAIGDRPVYLRRVDGHAALASSAAMKLAGITASTPDPDGGRIIRDASGQPTGVFVDAAMDLVSKVIAKRSHAEVKAAVLASANAIAAEGLTGMHDAGIDAATITAVKELIDEGRFPIRVYAMLGDDDELLADWFRRGALIGHGGRLTVRAVKLYADGALGSRGAALLAPYSDDPHNSGLMLATPEHLEDVARRARQSGFQVNTHAIGDRGIRNVLDAYADAGVGAADRYRVEHLQVIEPGDVSKLVSHGIIASMQPTHATSDMYWAEDRVGHERIRGAYAWRTVLDAGGRIALGSDFPVELVNPFHGLFAAVTRQDQKGHPDGGWYPSQKLTLAEALRGFTIDAAYAAFEESSRGTIEPGKLADFTIVEGNFFETPAEDLWKAKVRATVVGGDVVYGSAER